MFVIELFIACRYDAATALLLLNALIIAIARADELEI